MTMTSVILRKIAALQVSPAERALYEAARRDSETARDALAEKVSEAALSGNPARARYYEGWAAR